MKLLWNRAPGRDTWGLVLEITCHGTVWTAALPPVFQIMEIVESFQDMWESENPYPCTDIRGVLYLNGRRKSRAPLNLMSEGNSSLSDTPPRMRRNPRSHA